jgi:hypothetical protein
MSPTTEGRNNRCGDRLDNVGTMFISPLLQTERKRLVVTARVSPQERMKQCCNEVVDDEVYDLQ